MRRDKRRDVVEVTVVLVVRENEDGLLPNFGTTRENFQRFAQIPGPYHAEPGVIGEALRARTSHETVGSLPLSTSARN